MTSDINTTRLNNLRKLIAEKGGVTAVAKAMGYANPSFLSQMAGPRPTRAVTEKAARKVEQSLGLPIGYLDGYIPTQPQAALPGGEPVELISMVIRMAGKACETQHVAPNIEKFADLVSLIYQEAAENGKPDERRINQMVSLLK